MRFLPAILSTVIAAACPAFAQPAAGPEADVKLFETSEVDRSKGCSVALWQADRDPDTDKFAYLFIEKLTGQNHVRQPARIKIGGQAVTLQRLATGGKNNGYNLFEYQLYRMADSAGHVVLELKLGPEEGEAVPVESGTMIVAMRGKQTFRASVKGGAGCVTPPAR